MMMMMLVVVAVSNDGDWGICWGLGGGELGDEKRIKVNVFYTCLIVICDLNNLISAHILAFTITT